MIVFPAKFTQAKDGVTVSFPGIPEAITCGYSEAQAEEYAVDPLKIVLSEYIKQRSEIPRPKARAKGTRPIRVARTGGGQDTLYEAIRGAGVRKADLARRVGWQKSQVDRLLDLSHSRLEQIEEALAALDKRLAIQVVAA